MTSRRWIHAGLLVLFVALLISPALLGQDDPANKNEAVKEKTLFDLIQAGGMVGHFIILTNVAGVAVVIDLFVNLKRDKLAPPEIVVELETLLDEEQFEEAVALCEGAKSYITSVVGAAMARIGEGEQTMMDAMGNALDEQNMKMNQKVAWLSLLGNIGPLLGLFGTVTGMVSAFQVIEQTKNPSPADLARGIYEALITTVEGLLVAIPMVSFFFFFRNKAAMLAFDLGNISEELVSKLKPVAAASGGKK